MLKAEVKYMRIVALEQASLTNVVYTAPTECMQIHWSEYKCSFTTSTAHCLTYINVYDWMKILKAEKRKKKGTSLQANTQKSDS